MEEELRCKYCNCKFIERIPAGPIVREFFEWLPLVRYSCEVCTQKYYKYQKRPAKKSNFIQLILKPRERGF
jgi:hypothetical protein